MNLILVGMSVRLVPATVFNTAVPMINRELGSIPRRSRREIVGKCK